MIDLNQLPLKQIVKNYFSKKFLYEELGKSTVGRSGQKWNFDGIIRVTNEDENNSCFGVFIKDWNRSIGVNQVRLLEKACIDMNFDGGLIVGNNFSSHAKTYGRSKGVQIVTKSELIFKLQYS
jgi:hypothetical protein